MRTSSVLALVLSSLVASAAADDLQIIKTKEVECERVTKVRPIPPHRLLSGKGIQEPLLIHFSERNSGRRYN
jgi:hypothetical protein